MKGTENSELPFISLFIGVLSAIIGITGKVFLGYAGNWRFSSVSGGNRWIFLLAGIFLIALSIPFVRKQKFSTPEYTDEEVKQAREKLDQIYQREHGSPPEEAKRKTAQPEEPAREEVQAKGASVRPASAFMSNAGIRQGLLAVLAGGILFFAGNLFFLFLGAVLFLFGLCRLVCGIMEVV